jgi:hypothetical protein
MSLVQQRKLLLFLPLLTSLIAVFAPLMTSLPAVFAPLMTPLHADRLGLSI